MDGMVFGFLYLPLGETGENRRLDTISEGLSYEEFVSSD